MDRTASPPPSFREPDLSALRRRRADWPAEALEAARLLQRDLDAWCRSLGLPTHLDPIHAETAVRQVWGEAPAWRPVALGPRPSNPPSLPRELAAWPADWRYRVAELERAGAARAAAVRCARGEHRRAAAAAA